MLKWFTTTHISRIIKDNDAKGQWLSKMSIIIRNPLYQQLHTHVHCSWESAISLDGSYDKTKGGYGGIWIFSIPSKLCSRLCDTLNWHCLICSASARSLAQLWDIPKQLLTRCAHIGWKNVSFERLTITLEISLWSFLDLGFLFQSTNRYSFHLCPAEDNTDLHRTWSQCTSKHLV